MKLTVPVVAALAPKLISAMPGSFSWSIDTPQIDGLRDITFPMNIVKAPREAGYYFAQQFGLTRAKEIGYIGLQPRPDRNGASIIHGTFSTFQRGSTPWHPNCHPGADGDPDGVSCAIEIKADYTHNYNLVVWEPWQDTWQGLLVGANTGTSWVIGEFKMPAGSGKIQNSNVGFVEYYSWNGELEPKWRPKPDCSIMRRTEASFGIPTTTTPGAGSGHLGQIDEDGHCIGKVGMRSYSVSRDWLHVEVWGAKQQPSEHQPSEQQPWKQQPWKQQPWKQQQQLQLWDSNSPRQHELFCRGFDTDEVCIEAYRQNCEDKLRGWAVVSFSDRLQCMNRHRPTQRKH